MSVNQLEKMKKLGIDEPSFDESVDSLIESYNWALKEIARLRVARMYNILENQN